MQVIKVGGQFFGYPGSVKRVSRDIGKSNEITLLVISAVKEITRILTMLNLVNYQNNISTEFKRKQYDFLYGLIGNIHLDLINRLFVGKYKKDVISEFYALFENLENLVKEMEGVNIFHGIVQYGELISSMIYHRYFDSILFENILVNAPDFLVTNSCKENQEEIMEIKPDFLNFFSGSHKLILTQGFIGRDRKGSPTTLGNDGSDYSAAKFAEFIHQYIKVRDVIFLKDVMGVYDSDPKMNPFAKIIPKINLADYEKISQEKYVVRLDAISTLVTSGIPTTIRSFLDWRNPGTRII